MFRLLEFLFSGRWACTHKWEVHKELTLNTMVGGKKRPHKIELLYILRCSKCGEITSRVEEVRNGDIK